MNDFMEVFFDERLHYVRLFVRAATESVFGFELEFGEGAIGIAAGSGGGCCALSFLPACLCQGVCHGLFGQFLETLSQKSLHLVLADADHSRLHFFIVLHFARY